MPLTLDVPGYRHVSFPFAAGRHQAANDIVSLVAELGDNYRRYHEYLAREVEKAGGRPEPADYANDIDGYMVSCAKVHELLNAEMFLRRCYAKRQLGLSFNVAIDRGISIVDDWHRLQPYDGSPVVAEKNPRNDPGRWRPAPIPGH